MLYSTHMVSTPSVLWFCNRLRRLLKISRFVKIQTARLFFGCTVHSLDIQYRCCYIVGHQNYVNVIQMGAVVIMYFHIVLHLTGMACVSKTYLFQGLTYIYIYIYIYIYPSMICKIHNSIISMIFYSYPMSY